MDKHFGYKEACDYIEDAARFGSRPGLERIRGLCERLNDPQEGLRFIHVAGTNGKGSTSCMISSVLAEAGIRTGMYTSPAVSGIRDHYRINGKVISESDYADCVSLVAAANDKLAKDTGDEATQFELETAVAFTYFKKNRCEAVILECGMGGRDDATNIVRNKICCVFASISLDHMQFLGDTVGKIADVKAGIITSDCPVIALDSCTEATDVIRRRCRDTGSDLYVVKTGGIKTGSEFPAGQIISWEGFEDIKISLLGTYQADNAALAIRTLSVINDKDPVIGNRIDESTLRTGLAKAGWPYRFEVICEDPVMIVDGAHNADAAVRLRESIERYLRGYKIILIVGIFADKEYEKVIKTLAVTADMIFTVAPPDNPRALPADKLAAEARVYCDKVKACNGIKEAYELAAAQAAAGGKNGDRCAVVACGSLSYLNELKKTAIAR